MKITIEAIKPSETKEYKYPLFACQTDKPERVVLFVSHGAGVLLRDDDYHKEGKFSSCLIPLGSPIHPNFWTILPPGSKVTFEQE